jgi:hypothetical protein
VCVRADGVFLWAVFAVQEMIKWADMEELAMLLERLDRMGNQLEEIFAYMLDNVEPAHRKTLAFYVKTMKWSRTKIITTPPSVALIVAAQEDISNWSYKTLAERCELEERRVTQWSHGLLEVKPPLHNLNKPSLPSYAWVPRTSQHIEHELRRHLNNTEESTIDWIVSEFDHYRQRVSFFDRRRISWLHRSAFDFFFSPTSQSHTRQTDDLLNSYNDSMVTSALIHGLRRLMLTLPHGCKNPCFACLLYSFNDQAAAIIRAAAKATFELDECHDDALDQVLTTILAWKHRSPHSEPVTDYHVAFHEMRATPWHCPFENVEPVHECVKDNCIVRLDLDTPRRDHTRERISLENDTYSSLRGNLSEALFWTYCVEEKVSPSYTAQRCATLYKRRAGGVILACILEAMHIYQGCELSADEMRLEAHVRGQIQLWFNHHATAPDRNASRWLYITTMVRISAFRRFRLHTIVSCLSFQVRGLTPGQDVSKSGATSHDVEDDKGSEEWMLTALASIFANRRPRHELYLQLSQLLAPWDICVDIGRYNDLAIMIHVTELVRINHTIFVTDQIDVASLRLMLGDPENGRMASHEISRDIARRICKHCTEKRPSYSRGISRLGKHVFVLFAEDLLQDVHRNPILIAIEKAALEDALCVQLVNRATSKVVQK